MKVKTKPIATWPNLPDDHKAFNAQGQLVDRHGSLLHLHVIKADYYELRSPGPDKILWTADDQQINPSGSFLKIAH